MSICFVCVCLPASKRAHCFIHNRTPVTTINNQTVRVYVCLQLTKLSSTKYLYYQLHRGNVCVKEYLYLGDHTLSTISVMFVLRILVPRWLDTVNHQPNLYVEEYLCSGHHTLTTIYVMYMLRNTCTMHYQPSCTVMFVLRLESTKDYQGNVACVDDYL